MENSDARAFRLVRCPRCHNVLPEPAVAAVYRCGGCGTTLRAKVRAGSTGEVAGASSRKESANPEVSDISVAREQSRSSDAERSATSPGGSVHLTKQGSQNSTTELLDERKKTSKGQADLPDAATMRHSGEAAAQPLFSDHEEPAPKSSAQTAQSARDVPRKEDDAAAATAGGKVPELQAENLGPLLNHQQMFKTADPRIRALEPSVTQKLPAAKEAKQRLPPRNHCRPVLKGAPFIVCSGCFKLVQVPVDFAVSTKEVHKLRCGSCSAVLSYTYRDPAKEKTCQKSIDQLSIGSSKLWPDAHAAGLPLLEVLGEPGAPRQELGRQPETWTKDLKRHVSEVKNVITTQGLDSHRQVEKKSQSSFYKDVQAWFSMGNRYGGGLDHHVCMQQVGPKLLGRNDMRQMIMEKLLLDRNGGVNCTVICINAGSGHGKTSLLHALYNDQVLTDTFDKRIWIQLSDKIDMLMLFRKIVEVATNDHCSISNLLCLQEMVKEEIADKKFLLFLDDADIEDRQFWSTVIEVFNFSAKGSAIIMATKISTVISTFRDVATHFYFLNPLSEENSLMLLQQQAAVGTDVQRNPDLLMVAHRIISRFGGNPLYLKVIGGLLCHADSSLEMDNFEGNGMPLQLCHDVLPIHLKKCLAFCSLFPEGYIFDKHHMVPKWISHGCVRPAEGCELEDAGVGCFNELLCRSFFQYSPVHDDRFVMHEIIYKVVESVSLDKYFKSEDPTSSIPENILHLSLVSSQFQTVELMSKTEELKDLQTFLVVQPEWQPYKISFPTLKLVGLNDFFLKFTSLETLDLSHTDTEELPGSIVGLRNLQYLSVSNTSIRALPSELCCLSNLQTLEAKDCRFLTELPGDTKKLLKLRHLDVTKDLGYVQLPHGVGQLTELRTLPVFHASSDPSHCSVSELGNLHNLRGSLRLSGLETVKTGSKAQEANLKEKHHLKDLTLQWHDGGINIDDEDEDEETENMAEEVLDSLQPHTNLQELAIRGYEGSSFPAWMQGSSSLPNLVSLTLDSCCNCAQFPAVAQLPSLKFLGVRRMYDVKRLTNNTHGATKLFPSLELLNLWEMYGLEELFEASEGDCPRLRKVCISRCPDLKRLPRIPSVTELVLHCGHQLPADIPELASLVSLKIEGFHGVESFSLPAAAALPALKKLEIRSCRELSSVEGLSALTTVQRLKVAGCPKLVLPRTDDSLTT